MRRSFFLLGVFITFYSSAQVDIEKDSIDIMIGQMIMIGIGDFNKASGKQAIYDEIKNGRVGGVVLYEKNIFPKKPKPELAKLVDRLQKNAGIPLFVSIDEEGGKVNRLKPKYGFRQGVSAQYLGELNNLDSSRFYANQIASTLNSFGINMNYAPVVDVNINTNNPVIGKLERSYSTKYQEVTDQAYEVIAQHNSNQVVSVLKHFPGHGSSKNDTHLGLADVTETWQLEELYPYKSLIDSGVIGAVMTAHIVHKSLDATKMPATLSKKVVTGMLREFLEYDGVIISDDMQMGAINNEYGLKEAVSLSINAGVDILMFANNVKDYNMVSAGTVHSLIKDLLSEGVITRERIFQSYRRIMKLKEKFGLMEEGYYYTLNNKLKAHN